MNAGVIAQAAGLFAVTNFDDIVVLSLFFAQGSGQHGATRRVVAGQYLAFTAILAVSLSVAYGASFLPNVLAMTTGLRRGEPLALRWDDIDLGSRQLHVRRAMQRVGGKLQVVELKTSSSRRTVVLPRFAVRHLQEHKIRQDAERQALGEAWREHGLVFASSIGTPIEPRNVNRRWDELRRKAGLDWLRLHDLRHGCATFLQVSGVASAASFGGLCERRGPGLRGQRGAAGSGGRAGRHAA